MFALPSRKLLHTATFALASAFLLANASPAMALCKYGTPNCVNPLREIATVSVDNGPTIDGAGNGWEDPDCAYYGNCLSDNHDDGCWYVNGVCRPNPQPPPRTAPNPRLSSRTTTTTTAQPNR